MGVDLSGGGPSLNWLAWEYCLETAKRHGWEPDGTLAPHLVFHDENSQTEISVPADEWNGTYYSNEGQAMSESDARNLAAALDRAIKSMGNVGPDCELLRSFADRARRGSFLIF